MNYRPLTFEEAAIGNAQMPATGIAANYNALTFRDAAIGNGNRQMMGGEAKMKTPYGELKIPNPWAQQWSYQQQWNAGRWSVNQLGPMQRGGQYGSVGAIQGYIDSITSKYPQLLQNQALNPYVAALNRYQDASSRLEQLRAQPRTEQVIAGQGMQANPLDAAISAAEAQVQSLSRNRELTRYRGNYQGGFKANAMANIGFEEVARMKPTTSNLPIVERMVA